jgi:predicted DNA-binding mobile mystery protein A
VNLFYDNRIEAKRLRRLQLDAQLLPFASLAAVAPPSGGWIHDVREALGMSLATFATRLGEASSSTAYQFEQAEADGGITLKRLRVAANALGCDVAVVLIPRVPLTQIAEERAIEKARERLRRVGHSMAMEDQGVSGPDMDEITRQTAQEIRDKGGAALWE